ncbi:MAG: glycosyltransferase family 2 protein [Erysipelotrichaceae bacterium]|nr:glycosyltransferase family 2 protein [Erysipelotrichaceae bacterium]
MSKVTIVVPTYNVEAYIEKCLTSLVEQTIDDYEVLVINDGSPANEQVIIDRFVNKYPFVKSIVKENGGYGSVLNKALEVIDSPYMMICDPDDYLYPHTVDTLLRLMEKNDVDLVIGAKTLVYADNDEELYDLSYNNQSFTIDENRIYSSTDKDFERFFFIEPSPHAKLYKTEIVKKIKFPTKVSYTDNLLYFLSLIQIKRVVFTNQPLAYYLINRIGNTRTDVKLSVINSWIVVFKNILEQSKKFENIPGIFYYRMFEGYKHVINDKINNVVGTRSEIINKLDELYQVIEMLIPNKKQLLKYYDRLNEYQIIERVQDHLLLNKYFSKAIYKRIITKKLALRRD